MTSFIAMSVMTLVAFIIARRNRSHKAFLELMFVAMLGYIVGASVKSTYANIDDNQNVAEQLISNPTLPNSSSTIVGIVDDTTSVMGQDTLESDTIVPKQGKVPTRNNNTEIEDDS